MYRVIDANDYVCLRETDKMTDHYVRVVGHKSEKVDSVGAFAITSIPDGSKEANNLIGKKQGSTVIFENKKMKVMGIYDEKYLLEATVKFLKEMNLNEEAKTYEKQLAKINK